MNTIQRHRVAEKYKDDLDYLIGDADTTRTATSALAELLSAGGSLYADKQAKDAAAAKDATDKAKQAAADKDKNAALADYKAKSKLALDAQADAHTAQLIADTEKDPNGPLHTAAKKSADKAAQLAAVAAGAQDKLAYYDSGVLTSGGVDKSKGSKSSLPLWAWIVGGVVGVGGLGFVGYKLLGGRR
jgi:hypothetical protein